MVKKKANELRVGDKILGQTNFYVVMDVRASKFTGNTYPVIDIVDSKGQKMTVETGASEKFQDHIYEVDSPPVPVEPVSTPAPEVVPVAAEEIKVPKVAKKKVSKKKPVAKKKVV